MTFSCLRTSVAHAIIQNRTSPISRVAFLLTLVLAAVALIISMVTKLTFLGLPNIFPLVLGVIALDVVSQFVPQTRIVIAVQTILYGILYLAITCFCGVLAAYAVQRLALPLQDHLFASADIALGVKWFAVAHWVDSRRAIEIILKLAYESMGGQIALPLVVLALSNRLNEVRVYVLAFAIALTITTVVSAFLPAASPIAFIDRATFNVLRFASATPLDHLTRLRTAGPVVLTGALGGIITFPSFHATIATLTPLTLRRYRNLFIALLILDAAMLGGCVTEGAHYVSDVIAGSCVGFFAYLFAKHIIRVEDRLSPHSHNQSIGPRSAARVA